MVRKDALPCKEASNRLDLLVGGVHFEVAQRGGKPRDKSASEKRLE